VGDVNIKQVTDIDPIRIQEVDRIAPLTIASVDKVAPVAIHVKELNQIEPLLIESLRVDAIRNLDPLRVDRLNVTRLPVVNLSINQVPGVDINVRRLPPVSVGVHQVFEIPSHYTARAQFLGFEIMRVQLEGRTRVIPRGGTRREQAHVHERSFPDVAAVGNPAIPTRAIEQSAEVKRPGPPPRRRQSVGPFASRPRPPLGLSVGPPRFSYVAAERSGVRSG
jgi:hypothetical protein